jgi:hypothetical protein
MRVLLEPSKTLVLSSSIQIPLLTILANSVDWKASWSVV